MEVGESAEGRPLWLVRIGEALERDPEQADNAPPEQRSERPCILFYAREHPDEHDTSWVAQGVIDFLLSNHRDARAIRRRFTVLVVPILDPDGAVANVYETDVIRGFDDGEETTETLAWATWLRDWVDAGNRLDLVVNLHNVESGEGPHLFPYLHDSSRIDLSQALHDDVVDQLDGFDVRADIGRTGRFSTRLGGWLLRFFGTHHMFYEVNSQAPRRHLALYELKALGVGILRGAATHLFSPRSARLRQLIQHQRQARYGRWERYGWLERMYPPGQPVFEAELNCAVRPAVENIYVRVRRERQVEIPEWFRPLFDRYGFEGAPEEIRFDPQLEN